MKIKKDCSKNQQIELKHLNKYFIYKLFYILKDKDLSLFLFFQRIKRENKIRNFEVLFS